MRTVKCYTRYCKGEQARKAFQLGAPLESVRVDCVKNSIWLDDCRGEVNKRIPTTQQLVAWLREQGLYVEVHRDACEGSKTFIPFVIIPSTEDVIFLDAKDGYDEAEEIAINAALDYLTYKTEGMATDTILSSIRRKR